MATTKRKPLDTQAGIELYIMELANEYKVSDRFLVSVIPKIKDIFGLNVSPEQRDALLDLAEKSFKLQADTEAILNTVATGTRGLQIPDPAPTRSRRKSHLTHNTTARIQKPANTHTGS